MPEFQINYLAVGVAALTTIVIGMLWYSPLLFGKLWLQARGYTQEQMRASAGRNLLVSLLCYVMMALVLALLVFFTGAVTAWQGAALGFLVWAGFLATLGMTAHLYSNSPLSVYFIDAGYQLVYAVAMGVILAIWR